VQTNFGDAFVGGVPSSDDSEEEEEDSEEEEEEESEEDKRKYVFLPGMVLEGR
jgi:hypothetical protein